MKVG